ncbi:MAG: hypothetical protein ACHQQS_05895 [Thermoanaerobaculales bacterium]
MLLALLLAVLLGGAGGEVAAGTSIVAVRIVEHDVFDLTDPETSSWPYRWAVHLHVLTRERFIRSLLLFKVGDPLDPARLAESERILRATGFLSPVNITVHPAPGGAEVVVETHDQWTTLAGLSLGAFGNRKHVGGSMAEKNFLGWGKWLEAEYDSSTERTTTTFKYVDNLFLATRWQLELLHRNASDGKTDFFSLTYPFFALATPRAGGVDAQRATQTEYLYANGNKVVSGSNTARTFDLWGGIRMPWDSGTTDRLTVGIFSDKSEFARWQYSTGTPYPNPVGHDMAGVLIGWDHEADRWAVVRGFRGWQRQEDVPFGPNLTVQAGVSLPAFGGDQARVRLTGALALGALSGAQYSWLSVATSGRAENGTYDNAITHLEMGTAQTGPVGWRARVAADLGHQLNGDQQLALGADVGLRGWDPGTFDGTSRAVANLEWRHVLTGEVLHLGIIGGTVFVDAGKTWAPRVGPSTDGIRKDIGVGLLVESTRASLLQIVRVEAAMPDRGKGPVFVVTSVSLF